MSATGGVKWLAIAAAAVAAVVLALTVHLALGPRTSGPSGPKRSHEATLFCTKCGHVFKAKLTGLADLPAPCPACKEKAALMAWRCPKCKKTFGWNPKDAPTDSFEPTRCPACKAEAEPVDRPLSAPKPAE